MISKKKQVMKMFGLLPGIDFKDDSELTKYIAAVDSYLDSLCVEVRSKSVYTEEACEELDAIDATAYESAREAFASRTGPLLKEEDAREELLADTGVSYIYDEEGFFVVFSDY